MLRGFFIAVYFAFCVFMLPGQTLPTISTTPGTLTFSYQIGTAALPASQSAQVKASGTTTALDFSITVPATAPWLIITPLTGKTGASVGVRVNPTSELAGTYTALVQVNAAGSSGPATLTVTLVIKNPPPNMLSAPASLAYTFVTDQAAAPPGQTITVSTDGEPVSFTVAAAGGTWLLVDKTNGIAVSGSPVVLNVSVDTTGLSPGSYTGRITITSSNASNKTIVANVSLVVTAGQAVISSIWPNAAAVGSDDYTITIRGQHLFKTSSVSAGATVLTATWVSTSVLLAVIPKASLATQGALAITVTNAPKPASNAATFTVTPPGPIVQAVVNAASFVTAAPTPTIAPGEIISIFGSSMGPAKMLIAPLGTYPNTLGTPATIVEFELTPGTGVWTAAPIILAQANQINAVAPFGLTIGTKRHMRVTYNSLTSAADFVFDAIAADPGIFTIDSSGQGQAAVLNYDATTKTYSINSAANPSAKGSIVSIYLTGGGVTTPAATDGQSLPFTGTLPVLAGAVSVTIGGDGAAVQSATLVPGAVTGLVQINATVPTTIKAAKDHAVVVVIATHTSPATATIAVK